MGSHVHRALIVICAGAIAACGRMQPKTPMPVAALEIPAPPARLLIPVELPEPEPEPPVTAEIPTAAPTPPRPRETAARPVERPAPAAAPATDSTPAPVLQTTTDVGPLEQKITGLLVRAELDLRKVNFRELSSGARAQFDQAYSFIRMAKDALNVKNYMYAELLANKASDLARLLVRD